MNQPKPSPFDVKATLRIPWETRISDDIKKRKPRTQPQPIQNHCK